jgi:hypothetical protein
VTNSLKRSEQKYAECRVEVQIATILMHAWSEVEHDLTYKPLSGNLSLEEKVILDEVNGLVLSGELALDNLQRAFQRRSSTPQTQFHNHFELAAVIYNYVQGQNDVTLTSSDMGRTDKLLDFLRSIGMDTPKALEPFLEELSADTVVLSISESLARIIVDDHSAYLEKYSRCFPLLPSTAQDQEAYAQRNIAGMNSEFLAAWKQFEQEATELGKQRSRPIRNHVSMSDTLRELKIITELQEPELRRARLTRNQILRGDQSVDEGQLRLLTGLLETLTRDIQSARVTGMPSH